MSEQTLSRLLTFAEFAPQCLEAAERWIDNHPQGDTGQNDTFTLVAALRNCIDRGMSESLSAQQERENPLTLTNVELREMFGKPVFVVPRPVFDTKSGHEYADPLARLPRWGIVGSSWITCLPKEYAEMVQFAYHFEDNGVLFDAYAHEPKGEHHG